MCWCRLSGRTFWYVRCHIIDWHIGGQENKDFECICGSKFPFHSGMEQHIFDLSDEELIEHVALAKLLGGRKMAGYTWEAEDV